MSRYPRTHAYFQHVYVEDCLPELSARFPVVISLRPVNNVTQIDPVNNLSDTWIKKRSYLAKCTRPVDWAFPDPWKLIFPCNFILYIVILMRRAGLWRFNNTSWKVHNGGKAWGIWFTRPTLWRYDRSDWLKLFR